MAHPKKKTVAPPPEPLHKLKLALLRAEIAQFDAARRLSLSETRLSRIIRGRVQATPSEAKAIATLVGGRVEELFPRSASAKGGEK